MPAAATGSVATAAAPDPATCLPASSHQLQPPVRQSSHSKWELCDETEELFIFPFDTLSNIIALKEQCELTYWISER